MIYHNDIVVRAESKFSSLDSTYTAVSAASRILGLAVEIKGSARASEVLRVALQQFELKLALFILATSFNFLKVAT